MSTSERKPAAKARRVKAVRPKEFGVLRWMSRVTTIVNGKPVTTTTEVHKELRNGVWVDVKENG